MITKWLDAIRHQWMGALALFLVLGGGVAYGANTVFSTDIVDGEVKTADLAANSVTTGKVANNNLTGTDIKNQSGVDNCTSFSVRFDDLCARVLSESHSWLDAVQRCAVLKLRMPSLGEGLALAWNFNLPDLGQNEYFWTEEQFSEGSGGSTVFWNRIVNDAGALAASNTTTSHTVCVTTPTN